MKPNPIAARLRAEPAAQPQKLLNELAANEIDRLERLLAQMHADVRELEREHSQELRDVADEARWEGQQDAHGGIY